MNNIEIIALLLPVQFFACALIFDLGRFYQQRYGEIKLTANQEHAIAYEIQRGLANSFVKGFHQAKSLYQRKRNPKTGKFVRAS